MIYIIKFFLLTSAVFILMSSESSAESRPNKIRRKSGLANQKERDIEENKVIVVGKRMGAVIRGITRTTRKKVCYDLVGCFHKTTALQESPQSPRDLDTKFFLHTRHAPVTELSYSDGKLSLAESDFTPSRNTRIVVHGFKGSSKDRGAQAIAKTILDHEDCNVILLDWEKGAKGQYRLSAANTQIVGRQLALLLLDLISYGTPPSNIHVIGFSLGAHIAGYAGKALTNRGIRIARITGLDPASPLFRENLRVSLASLSKHDAAMVDIIHTDGAALWTEGFGLLKVLGHVDFFPNGGHNQPGCTYVRASVLVSHLEGVINSSVVCNHARGFQLFLESTIKSECKFRSYPCTSRESFLTGACFPSKCDPESTDGSCSIMGYDADKSTARGPLYLTTRDTTPFCGDQLQAEVIVSKSTVRTRGHMQLVLQHNNDSTTFYLNSDLRGDMIEGLTAMRGLSAARFNSISSSISPNVTAILTYRSTAFQEHPKHIHITRIRISSLDGDRWYYCGDDILLEDSEGHQVNSVSLELSIFETC